ncbi:hypothetical protein EcB7A_1130 [Escherichia coli B7A]|nr:hypothetical protein EcB7A_1130 [Escherichia coli B7A]
MISIYIATIPLQTTGTLLCYKTWYIIQNNVVLIIRIS